MTPRSPHTAVHTLQRATPALFCPPPRGEQGRSAEPLLSCGIGSVCEKVRRGTRKDRQSWGIFTWVHEDRVSQAGSWL